MRRSRRLSVIFAGVCVVRGVSGHCLSSPVESHGRDQLQCRLLSNQGLRFRPPQAHTHDNHSGGATHSKAFGPSMASPARVGLRQRALCCKKIC